MNNSLLHLNVIFDLRLINTTEPNLTKTVVKCKLNITHQIIKSFKDYLTNNDVILVSLVYPRPCQSCRFVWESELSHGSVCCMFIYSPIVLGNMTWKTYLKLIRTLYGISYAKCFGLIAQHLMLACTTFWRLGTALTKMGCFLVARATPSWRIKKTITCYL